VSSSTTERGSGNGAGPASEAHQGTEVVMPQMGVSVAEGTIVSWLKEPGEEVSADEPICEVTTDKIDVEIPSPAAGTLREIVVGEGETVTVGTVIALLGEGGAAPKEEAEAETGTSPDAADPPDDRSSETSGAETREREDPGPGAAAGEIDRSRFYSPVVRRIAGEHGVDLAEVEGHGVGGRVRKSDLLAHLREREDAEQQAPAKRERVLHSESPYRPEPRPEPVGAEAAAGERAEAQAGVEAGADELTGPTRRVEMDPMRKAIARHMTESRRTAAHCTTVVEADFSAVARSRTELREPMKRRGVPLTYLTYVARATVETLQRHPVLNASIDGDELVMHEDVNLGIAVALEQGLVVPVIRRAQRLSLEGMAAAIDDVATKAREGRLEPDDVHGGTFTITNPGQFGAVLATPIINQPQVAILDLEAIVRRPVVVDGDGGESIGIRPMSYLCMSWDHRALDGAVAARFLAEVRESIESGGIR
jgi:2-oxoglutarate dehydrogenase dihydrolipoamide succinyltransferase (E2 component)